MRFVLMAALGLAASGQGLVIEAPERVRAGESVTLRVTRDTKPVPGAEIRIVTPANERGYAKARTPIRPRPDEKAASILALYPKDAAPVVSASAAWCEIIDPAGGRGFVPCEALDRYPWGAPLGRTDDNGGLTLTPGLLALAPMAVVLQAALGNESSALATLEVEFPETTTRETVAAGIELTTRRWVKETSGPFAMQVLEVDPHTPAVNVFPVRANDTAAARETTSSMAARYGAAAAVNGGYFTPQGASAGLYVWNQQTIEPGKDRAAIAWCQEQEFVEDARIAMIDSASPARPCPVMDIVGAGPRLVQGGAVNVGYDEKFGHARLRHPRTAFAITNRGTMLFVTVDGRQARSAGMTLEELAEELVKLGAAEAINLDGGGSTTMVASGAVRNHPSDGQERAVSDALLVFSVATLDDLNRLLDRLAVSRRHLAPGLHAQLRAAVANESRGDFLRLLLAASREHLSWQALRLLEEAAALLH